MLLSMAKEPHNRPEVAADDSCPRQHLRRWHPAKGAQAALAKATGLSEGTISQVMNDGSFSVRVLKQIAEVFGLKHWRDLFYPPEEVARIEDFLAGIRAEKDHRN